MSVVIKGMTMPSDCRCCPCRLQSMCQTAERWIPPMEKGFRPDWCPLEEVDDD